MASEKVKVIIGGNTYFIEGDAPSEYILRLADYVNGKMDEVSKSMNTGNMVQTAILAALNIADEYFQLKEIEKHLTGDIEKKTTALISMLEEGIIGDIFSKQVSK